MGLPHSAELVQATLGVLRLGGQVVPLDRQSPPARRDATLADAAAATVIHDWLPGLPPLTPADLLAGTAEPGVPAEPAPASFLFYTSGTTGPKRDEPGRTGPIWMPPKANCTAAFTDPKWLLRDKFPRFSASSSRDHKCPLRT